MFDLITPVASVPWINIVLILLTALASSVVIVISTQRSVRNIGLETAKMVASIQGAHQATQTASAGSEGVLVTLGRGEVVWREGGYTVKLARRLRSVSSTADENNELADLAQRLMEIGVDPEDLQDRVSKNGETVISFGMDVAARDSSMVPKILELAQTAGFIEQGDGREEITSDDAHETAGQRAVRDAERNINTLSSSLGIARSTLHLVGADLETVQADGGRVVKIARARWRVITPVQKAA